MGAIVTVVDISPKNLEAMPFSCEKICDNAEELSKIKDNHYDVVFCRALLHHLSNPLKALQSMKSKLVSGGQLIFIEPLSVNFLLNIGRLWR